MYARGLISGLVAAAIWGGMYVVSEVVLEVIPPFLLLTLRLLLGILALGIVVAWRGGFHIDRDQVLRSLAVGVLGYGISLGFQFVGTKLSTAANGAVVTAATPAFVFMFAPWILRERVTLRRGAALTLATMGVLTVIDPRSASISPELFSGNLFLVGAALTWALYSVLVRALTRDLSALPLSFIAFCGGLLIAIPAGIWELANIAVGELTLGILAGVLYLGIISTALAAYLWNKAFEILEAGIASLTFFAQPVFGATLGMLLLGEQLSFLFLIGGVLIGLGLWLAAAE